MHYFRTIFLSLSFLLLFLSCSDDEDNVQMTQEPLIGAWEGLITQADYGTLEISVNINSISVSNKAGNVTYASKDLSQCDEDIFVCSHITCSGSWTFTEKTGSIYTFSETFAEGSDCGNGTVELSLTNDNELSYYWIEDYSDPSTASGSLKRK